MIAFLKIQGRARTSLIHSASRLQREWDLYGVQKPVALHRPSQRSYLPLTLPTKSTANLTQCLKKEPIKVNNSRSLTDISDTASWPVVTSTSETFYVQRYLKVVTISNDLALLPSAVASTWCCTAWTSENWCGCCSITSVVPLVSSFGCYCDLDPGALLTSVILASGPSWWTCMSSYLFWTTRHYLG